MTKSKTKFAQLTLEEQISKVKELDTKYDKQRKTATKQEKKVSEAEQLIQAYLKQNSQERAAKEEVVKKIEIKRSEDEWDVKIGDKIEYFDPTLSYELTGYRPITKDRGLDFDPKDFTKAAEHYRQFGRYSDYPEDTYLWGKYWDEEFRRCRDGYTVGKYTLTGENYYWLNYYRLESPAKKGAGGELRSEDFPVFVNKQYEYFHYMALCRKLGKDCLAFKSRGVGASEIAASNCANAYTFFRASNNLVTAALENFVKDTLDKIWRQFDFLNTETEGAFAHLRLKQDTAFEKRASYIDENRNEGGWMSQVKGIVSDSADKIRGKRVMNLYFEEAGSHPKLLEAYTRSEALVENLGRRVGMRTVFGTSTSKGPSLAGMKEMFYNPEDYNILPYLNPFMANGVPQLTGYFIPSFTMWFGPSLDDPGYDERGVVDEERAKQFYIEKRNKIKDPQALLANKAEFCFTPEDAFIMEGENRFNRELLASQMSMMDRGQIEKPKHCRLHWSMKDGTVDYMTRPTIEFDANGPIQIVELPKCDENNIPYTNLYCAGIDSIDSDNSTTTGQTDLSDFCIVILRRQFGLESPKIVALYKGRPQEIRQAYDIALKLCKFYNCKCLIEASKISIVTWLKEKHQDHILMKRPKATNGASTKSSKSIGVPAIQTIIEHQIDLIADYVNDYCDEINYPEIIDELLNYSYANKRKFDIVAALGMVMLANEDMQGRVPRIVNNKEQKELTEIGYYKDEYGQVHFGIKNKLYERGFDTESSEHSSGGIWGGVQQTYGYYPKW